jgi:hypothetical protein
VRVDVSDFLEAVRGELEDYANEVTEAAKDSVKEVVKETVAEVKKRSPVHFGNYKKSWGQTTVFESASSIRISIHNKKHYRLAHLLEDGHALVGGGRVKAYPHIKPAEQFAERKLQRKIELKVKG